MKIWWDFLPGLMVGFGWDSDAREFYACFLFIVMGARWK